MTLIGCFDRSPIQNVAACLQMKPEKLIFLGDEAQMREPVKRYREFFARRKLPVRVLLRNVTMADLKRDTDALARIVREEGDCVFDVTGGDEVVLMAVGAVLAGLDERQRSRVAVQKFDPVTWQIQDCDGDGRVHGGVPGALTVAELIALHGGVVHPWETQPRQTHRARDLDGLWELVSGDAKRWNSSLSALNEFESRSESKMDISLSLHKLRNEIKDFNEKLETVKALLADLHRAGVIETSSDTDRLRYTYTSPAMRYCTQKAGNVLEIKTLLEACDLRNRGKPYFDDCQMGVGIDWDGIIHPPQKRIPETRNEIDVLLTRGVTPLFVSCKNGDIGDEELYKLHTVATRFGGPYARKMLVATRLDRKSGPADQAFIQRAEDMRIHLVANAAELSPQDWEREFRLAMGEILEEGEYGDGR